MDNKTLLKLTVVLFLLINTSWFWEPMISIAVLMTFLLFFVSYFILVGLLFFQIIKIWQKKIKDKNQLLSIGVSFILLFSIYLKPAGLIDFNKYEGKDLLIAYRKGGGNCNTYFRLKENNRFTERSRCFGVTYIKGTYKIKGDTIFFDNISKWYDEDYYKYAIIDRSDSSQNNILLRYHDEDEPIKKYDLWITKDDLSQ